MKSIRLASMLVVPMLAALASSASAQLPQHADASLPAEPVRPELGGVGRGTLILPALFDGGLVATLVDDRTGATFLVDAVVTPYYFYAEHAPAGAIHGHLYALDPNPESKGEPQQIAAIEGEWGVNSDGEGALVAAILARSPGDPLPIGVIEGLFRTPPFAPPAMPLVSGGSSLRAATPQLAGASAPPAAVRIARHAGAAAAGGLVERPLIIVDSIPQPIVTRVALTWSMML